MSKVTQLIVVEPAFELKDLAQESMFLTKMLPVV